MIEEVKVIKKLPKTRENFEYLFDECMCLNHTYEEPIRIDGEYSYAYMFTINRAEDSWVLVRETWCLKEQDDEGDFYE